jgi:hypothetical protein
MSEPDLIQKITEIHTDVKWIKEDREKMNVMVGKMNDDIDELKQAHSFQQGALKVIGAVVTFLAGLFGFHVKWGSH